MRMLHTLLTLCLTFGTISCTAKDQQAMDTSDTAPKQPAEKITKSDAEWQQRLTPEQYKVARQAGTEAPNGQVYEDFKKQGKGTYYCVCCGAKLFSSEHKFDAHCGWPAFYDPADAENVKTKTDLSHGMVRIEVNCSKCDAHLGHLFKGEGFNTPTDQRYCINGVVLKFVPEADDATTSPQ